MTKSFQEGFKDIILEIQEKIQIPKTYADQSKLWVQTPKATATGRGHLSLVAQDLHITTGEGQDRGQKGSMTGGNADMERGVKDIGIGQEVETGKGTETGIATGGDVRTEIVPQTARREKKALITDTITDQTVTDPPAPLPKLTPTLATKRPSVITATTPTPTKKPRMKHPSPSPSTPASSHAPITPTLNLFLPTTSTFKSSSSSTIWTTMSYAADGKASSRSGTAAN